MTAEQAATTTDQPALFGPRTGVKVHTPARDGQAPDVWVDASSGLVFLDATDHHGVRIELYLRPDEATRLAELLARHAKEGRY